MYANDACKCSFCGRNAVSVHEARWEAICLCSACGYEDVVSYDLSIEEWSGAADAFDVPEPNEDVGFPELRSMPHNLAIYGWLDKLTWHLFYRPGDLCAREPRTGWTLLHAAAAGNQVNIVRHLVLRGADIDAVDLAGDTALHVAARWDCRDVIAKLLESNAAADLHNNAGQTAEEVAAARRHRQAVQLLRGSSVASAHTDSSAANSRC